MTVDEEGHRLLIEAESHQEAYEGFIEKTEKKNFPVSVCKGIFGTTQTFSDHVINRERNAANNRASNVHSSNEDENGIIDAIIIFTIPFAIGAFVLLIILFFKGAAGFVKTYGAPAFIIIGLLIILIQNTNKK